LYCSTYCSAPSCVIPLSFLMLSPPFSCLLPNFILLASCHHSLLPLLKLPLLSLACSMSSLSHSSSHHIGQKLRKYYECSLVVLLLLAYVVIFISILVMHGSNTFQVCTLNICSLLNPLKYTSIADLAESRHINLFALTETWITSSSTGAKTIRPPSRRR